MNATCKTCQTLFRSVDRSEDGIPEIPEQTKCADGECETYLCPAGCQELSFVCADCNQRFCHIHPVFVLDRDKYCGACFLEMRQAMLIEAGCTSAEMAALIGRSA